MTDRVAHDRAGSGFAGGKEFHPHLVCSWTLDPASHRLSCAWAPPAAGWEVAFLSPRNGAPGLNARWARTKAQA
jgi:hypothetical protein